MPNLRNRSLLLLDAILLGFAPFLLFFLRFEGARWPRGYASTAAEFSVVALLLQVLIYYNFGLYSRFWRFASASELNLIFTAGLSAGALNWIVGRLVLPLVGWRTLPVPYSVLFTYGLLSIAIIAMPRLAIRMHELTKARRNRRSSDRRVLIVGAGSAGHVVARELLRHPSLELSPVGFVDDDHHIHGLRLENLPVLGALAAIPKLLSVHRVNEIIIAMPRARGDVVREIVRMSIAAGVKARTIPSLSEILSGKVNISELRKIEIQDLLRRDPIQIDFASVSSMASNRTVLVTGAGGSIGSELCRQLADLDPARIILLGHGENSIFDIHNELSARYPGLELVPVIADVRDRDRIHRVLAQYRPTSVFHAAAHKHVPLMEGNPVESVTNNVMGTQNVVDAAVAVGVAHFVFVSTDKAVRPTNVMGASKRIAEHVVKHASTRASGSFVSVRFGNVLGSRGSVVPTFVRQIAAGGPVTITHPEMRRFFMTIPEAVQLVLQAAVLGRNGDLFMLDMGEPVRVVDLAEDLIRLSGLEVGKDIQIRFTGSRPGEKLYEEMFWGNEVAEPTEHPKVLRARKPALDPEAVPLIEALIDAARNNAGEQVIRQLMRGIVPDFTPAVDPNASDTPTYVPAQRTAKGQAFPSYSPEPTPSRRRTSGSGARPTAGD